MPRQTPSQTVGPFFSEALTPGEASGHGLGGNRLCGTDAEGAGIRIEGQVLDGAGEPVTDAMIEVWQADPNGLPGFAGGAVRGFGRASTDAEGRYWFETMKPGATAPDTAPHVSMVVFARGVVNHLFTRLYFSDEQEANRKDALLSTLAPDRLRTLVAGPVPGRPLPTYAFDIRLQGRQETVFLDL